MSFHRRLHPILDLDRQSKEVIWKVRAEASVRGTLKDIEVERRGGEQARRVEREA
jgi:hypothetical protein